jgi:hypothetical protein
MRLDQTKEREKTLNKCKGCRYLIFAGDEFYPSGGWKDCVGSAASIQQARETGMVYIGTHGGDWWQVVDTDTLEMVAEWKPPISE